jgi:hypothetical protein
MILQSTTIMALKTNLKATENSDRLFYSNSGKYIISISKKYNLRIFDVIR